MRLQTWRPAIVIAVVALGLLPLVAGCALGAAPPKNAAVTNAGAPTDAATTVNLVSPLNAAGGLRAGYSVTSSGRGYCWTTSFVNGRLYRCFEKNTILDPCWKRPGHAVLVCQPQPWSKQVTRLRTTKPLPAASDYRPSLWGLRIGGIGVNCLVSMGASGAVGNHPVSYLCARRWVLLGEHPDRSRPEWTMLTARQVGDHYVVKGVKPLTAAWKAVRP